MIPVVTSSLLLLAGICLYAGIHHIAWGIRQSLDRVHLVFGLMALAMFVASIAQMAIFQSTGIEAISAATRWNLGAILIFFLLLSLFIRCISNIGTLRWNLALALPLLSLFIANIVFPHGVQYAEISSIHTIEMPWHEKLNMVSGVNSPWFFIGVICTQLIHIYGMSAFIIAYRRTRKQLFLVFTACLAIILILSIQGVLTRMDIVHLPPLGIYGYLVMVFIMSAGLIRDSYSHIITSEQRFKALIEQAPLSILLISREGKVKQVNRAFETLWGVTAERIYNYDLMQDHQLAEKGVLPFLKQGLAGTACEVPAIIYNPAENPLVPGPQSDRHIRSFVYPIKDTHGQVQEVAMLQEDITERIKLQRDLADREHDLRSILDNLPSLIGYWDKNLRNRFANRAYEEWYGIDAGSIPGKHLSELLSGYIYQANMPYINKVLQGEPQMFERKITAADGTTTRHALIHYIPDILDGEVRGYYVLVSDVTALKYSESRLAKSQSIAQIGSWEIEIHTGINWWSDETYRIFGIASDHPLTLPSIAEMIHADDRNLALDTLQKAISTDTLPTFSIEYRIVLPGEKMKWVRMIAEIDKNVYGKPQLLSGVIQDITAGKQALENHERLQQQLMQSQKMESIGHLAGGIAHDFNNMLGAILGYAQLLRQVTTTEVSSREERTQKYIGEILTAGNRAKELIKQMMVFSRLNTEDGSKEEPATLISPVLKEVVSMLRSSIPSSIGINISIANESLKVRIKPVQLHQILLNLVINARDAIPEYGQIDIELNLYEGSGLCNACNMNFNGKYVNISVRDSGCGIPEEQLGKIFDPFFTTKAVGKGTGMGLSVVHGYVHLTGGHITVGSSTEAGTQINVLLPLAREESAYTDINVAPPFVPDSLPLSGLSIMVVDDELVVSSMLYDLLSHHGARVITFNDSEAALLAFRQNPQGIDLVVTDETMPNLSGMDMTRAMLQVRSDLPVILCTGYSEHVDATSAKEGGIAEFIYKPVDVSKLISRIAELRPAQP